MDNGAWIVVGSSVLLAIFFGASRKSQGDYGVLSVSSKDMVIRQLRDEVAMLRIELERAIRDKEEAERLVAHWRERAYRR